MTTETIPCPRCNSPQRFNKQYRKLAREPWIEVYIACKMCRWQDVQSITTKAIEDLRVRLAEVRRKRAYEEMMHGQASASMQKLEERFVAKLAIAERNLRMEVDHLGQAAHTPAA